MQLAAACLPVGRLAGIQLQKGFAMYFPALYCVEINCFLFSLLLLLYVMFSFLKNHPFAVEAFFEQSLVLTFSVPKAELQPLIPECLTLDTFNDTWAFVAVAMVQTKDLRPKGFPQIAGHDFFLTGYRIFVRYTTNTGKKLRGLYILKSETDKKKMEWLGNFFTRYKYTTTDITLTTENKKTTIRSIQSKFEVAIEKGSDEVSLPEHSPFRDWKEARRFAGPLPFTFSYNPKTKKVLIVEGVRENWHPTPVKVIRYHIAFLQSLHLNGLQLANAFVINNIPYHWKKGRTEKWNG